MRRAMLALALFLCSGVQAADEFTVEGIVNEVDFKQQKLNVTYMAADGLPGETTRDIAVDDPGILEEVQAGEKLKFTMSHLPSGALVITDCEEVVAQAPKSKSRSKKK